MTTNIKTIDDYLAALPAENKAKDKRARKA
jgi:hypothetical protein